MKRIRTAMVLAGVAAFTFPTFANGWSQLKYGQGEPDGQPISCTDVNPYYCTEWPTTSGGLSVTVEVFLSSTLDLITSEPIKTDFRNAWPQWNNIAARNPHLQETTSTTSDEIFVGAKFFDPALGEPTWAYAYTDNVESSTNPRRIIHSEIQMNRRISWNHSRVYTVTYDSFGNPTVVRADSRKVAVHELGHAEGLGHVLPSASWAAIMRQGSVTYTTVQSNDNLGIKEVYGAYP